MTKELTPHPFGLESQNSVIEIADVTLHQSVEADADGRILKLVWIEGRASPKLDRDTMAVELAFTLHAEGERLGICKTALEMGGDDDPVAFKAEGGLRMPRGTEVSRIELAVKTTAVNSFDPVDLKPRPVGD